LITDKKGMIDHVADFYKTLFGREDRDNIKLPENFWEEEEKVIKEENDMLEAPFSEEEIKRAIDGSYAEGAPRPDGFSFLFYQISGMSLRLTSWP
jgi:hypothetical protein